MSLFIFLYIFSNVDSSHSCIIKLKTFLGFVIEGDKNDSVQDELENYRKERAELSSKLDGKEKQINFLEGQLRSREQKHQDDLI